MCDIQSTVVKMDEMSVKRLLHMIAQEEIKILERPETGLLMMTVKDSFDTDFYLGELLVTEARVEYMNEKGYAMVMGDDCERALVAASIEAILSAKNSNSRLKQQIVGFVSSQKEKIAETERVEERLVAKTKVSFETMPEE